MSDATTALAEVLRGHRREVTYPWPTCACGAWDFPTIEDHVAAAVVAAVRGLSPDLQAELIGGEVEHAPRSLVTADGWFDQRRPVGPWTSEQVEETP